MRGGRFSVPAHTGSAAIEAALRDGRLLTPENRHDVLPRFFGLSRREAEAVAVSIRPAEVVPRREVVTAVRPAALATVDGVSRGPTATDQMPGLALRPGRNRRHG